MTASKTTWVCFTCRLNRRVTRPMACPDCGVRMLSIGARMCVPRRRDHRGWAQLERTAIRMYRWKAGRWVSP